MCLWIKDVYSCEHRVSECVTRCAAHHQAVAAAKAAGHPIRPWAPCGAGAQEIVFNERNRHCPRCKREEAEIAREEKDWKKFEAEQRKEKRMQEKIAMIRERAQKEIAMKKEQDELEEHGRMQGQHYTAQLRPKST